jgi:hypothetical protein
MPSAMHLTTRTAHNYIIIEFNIRQSTPRFQGMAGAALQLELPLGAQVPLQ